MSDSPRWNRLLLESFVPVVLLLAAIFLALLYVQFRTGFDAERVIVVDIHPVAESVPEEAGADVSDESAPGEAVPSDPDRARARALMAEKKWAEAERLYRSILARHPGAPALRDLGVLYLKRGNNDDLARALKYFERALRVDPGYSSALFNRALALARSGRKREAMAGYQALLARQPDHFQGRYNLAELLIEHGDKAAAAEALERAVQISSGRHKARALYSLGIVRRDLGQAAEARQAFEASIRLEPNSPAPRVGLATLESDTPDGQARALEQYRRIVELAPDYSPALANMAAILAAQGKQDEAEQALRQAVRSDPNDARAHTRLGQLLLSQERWQDARAEFEEVLRLDKSRADAYFHLGRIAYGQKAYDKAAGLYQEAVKAASGNYPEALVNLGIAQVALKNYPAALAAYQAALKLKPDDPGAWYNLGMLHLRQKQDAQAEKAFTTAVRLRPNYEQAWFNLGRIHGNAHRDQEAIAAYRKALGIRPDYPEAQINLALQYAKRKEYAEAIRLYHAVLSKDDSYAEAWHHLGNAYLGSGRTADAVAAFRKAVELDPGDTTSLRLLGHALLRDGKVEEAVQVLQNAVTADAGDARLRLELARALRQSGRAEEAHAQLTKARQLDPQLQENEPDMEESSSPP